MMKVRISPLLETLIVFIITGYTVDMLRQSKALLDNAKKQESNT
jgi:hypothetical protein